MKGENMLINNEMNIEFPEGFRLLSAEETGKMRFYDGAEGIVFSDDDRHMKVSIGYKKSGFASMMLSAAEVARNGEKKIREPMKAYGYRLEEWLEKEPDGKKASGFRYDYTAQETGMTGEFYVIKSGKTFYYLSFYARTARKEENLKVWNEILASIRFQ